jgi:hypothetical protein
MQLFNVLGDGELREIKEDKAIREHLKNDSVFLVVDDDEKRIWIWKGSNAPVRQKFISARAATQMREERGLMYKVNSEDEGDESDEFIKGIGETPKPRPQIKKPPLPKVESEKPILRPTVEPQINTKPIISPSNTSITQPQVTKPEPTVELKKYDHNSIIKKLDEIGIPHGFERELLIVGNEVYNVIEKTSKFLGKKEINKILEKAPMGTVPEGVFLAEEYTPRVIIDKGNVMAIEFLKQAKEIDIPGKSEKPSSLKDEMKFHLSDLIDFFKIETTDEKERKKKK